jgi:hemoglobin-like flavoprotein
MNPHQIALVQQSFKKLAPVGLKVAKIFYAELFAIDPSLRSMFKGGMEAQYKKLMSALSLVVGSLHAPEQIISGVEKLAVKQVDYGVRPEHYTYVGNALLRTLKKGLGSEFTPELCDAWTEAFRMLARIMKQAAYGRTMVRGVA